MPPHPSSRAHLSVVDGAPSTRHSVRVCSALAVLKRGVFESVAAITDAVTKIVEGAAA